MSITSNEDIRQAISKRADCFTASTGYANIFGWVNMIRYDLVAIGAKNLPSHPYPTDGAVCDSTTGGLIYTNASAGNDNYLYRYEVRMTSNADAEQGSYMLYDRLWHNGGFMSNITSVQTLSSPPALTRHTDGDGVEIWGEVQGASMGPTATAITVSYTNQDGVSGRTAVFPYGTYVPASTYYYGRMFQFQLQAGDTGVRSVQSAQLVASTGAVTPWGVVLLKRIATRSIKCYGAVGGDQIGRQLFDGDCLSFGLRRIEPDACLVIAIYSQNSVTPYNGHILHEVEIIEG